MVNLEHLTAAVVGNVSAALAEDVGSGDITARLIPETASAEASVIAPMEYIAMPMAVIYGFFVFGEWPEARTWVGIALIIGAGLFVYWREAVLGRRKSLESRRLRR